MIKSLRSQLETYRMNVGDYPPNLDALIDPNAAGNPPGWAGPYLTLGTPLNDAWGRPLRYQRIATKEKSTYSVTSAGPNGKFGDADDISSGSH